MGFACSMLLLRHTRRLTKTSLWRRGAQVARLKASGNKNRLPRGPSRARFAPCSHTHVCNV